MQAPISVGEALILFLVLAQLVLLGGAAIGYLLARRP
jgi:uncharacterized protein YneF (UPF0154 family)